MGNRKHKISRSVHKKPLGKETQALENVSEQARKIQARYSRLKKETKKAREEILLVVSKDTKRTIASFPVRRKTLSRNQNAAVPVVIRREVMKKSPPSNPLLSRADRCFLLRKRKDPNPDSLSDIKRINRKDPNSDQFSDIKKGGGKNGQ